MSIPTYTFFIIAPISEQFNHEAAMRNPSLVISHPPFRLTVFAQKQFIRYYTSSAVFEE